jgi:hypothetical protein
LFAKFADSMQAMQDINMQDMQDANMQDLQDMQDMCSPCCCSAFAPCRITLHTKSHNSPNILAVASPNIAFLAFPLLPPHQVHFIIASCENMVAGKGLRPGDVLKAASGKTVEVNK